LNGLHRTITGPTYRARDPELALWVHATLVESTIVVADAWLQPFREQWERRFGARVATSRLPPPTRLRPRRSRNARIRAASAGSVKRQGAAAMLGRNFAVGCDGCAMTLPFEPRYEDAKLLAAHDRSRELEPRSADDYLWTALASQRAKRRVYSKRRASPEKERIGFSSELLEMATDW